MLYWIRRVSNIIAGGMFFTILISCLLVSPGLTMATVANGLLYGLIGAILCWFLGFVVADIVLKVLVTHIDASDVDSMIDGGIVQQVQMMKERFVPGGKEMPFTEYNMGKSTTETPKKGKSADKV